MKKRLDEFSYHEAMDRAHVVATLFDSFVNHHDVVQANLKLERRAEFIADQLVDFYQLIAAARHKRFPEQLDKPTTRKAEAR